MKTIKKYALFLLLLLTVVSCSKDNEFYNNDTSDRMSFRIHTTNYLNEPATRADADPIKFARLDYYIFDEDNKLVSGIRSLYDADLLQIKAEGLKSGNYRLLVLAVNGDMEADGAQIHDISTIDQPWLTFDDKSLNRPLQAEYYYVNHSFSVSGGALLNPDIQLNRKVGLVDFDFIYNSESVRASVISIEMISTSNKFTFGSLNVDGSYSGSRDKLMPISLLDDQNLLLLPTLEEGVFSGTIKMQLKRISGELFYQNFSFSTIVKQNERSIIKIAVKNIDDSRGTINVTNRSYNNTNFYQILRDTEPSSVYYDRDQRSFKVNEPLQMELNGDKQFHVRFYSAVPLLDVTIMAKIDGVGSYFEFAHFDSIPAFADAVFSTPLVSAKSVYMTELGTNIEIAPQNNLTNSQIKFKVVTKDVYWQKIGQIKAKWNIYFNSYGGDPDAADGAPSGNWMGIRPVHIRESIALLTNIAWMNETDEYRAEMVRTQGNYKMNDGSTILPDNTVLISQMRDRAELKVGLVYTGNRVIGLGGGAIWGIYQEGFIDHYSSQKGNVETAFHELGHCMGYGHESSLTYGPWAGTDSKNVYNKLCEQGRLPVSSSHYLKSYESKYRY